MSAKEIRNKIKSIKSTQKITKAMEMVAASKVKRAQENMRKTRPYASNIRRVMGHLIQAGGEQHPCIFLKNDGKAKKVAYIVISTNRGLCGGLNINLFKELLRHIRDREKEDKKVCASVFGRKGFAFLSRINVPIMSYTDNLSDTPTMEEMIGGVRAPIEAYVRGEVSEVYLVSNLFINAMTQQPKVSRLLPLEKTDDLHVKHAWDYLYEPSSEVLLEKLIRRYIEAIVKWAAAENTACEMSARMLAMKNATDNAEDLISELQLIYNKARQGSITQELTEIVAGASAV